MSPGAARSRKLAAELGGIGDGLRAEMAALLQPLDQGLGVDAVDRRLAGRIDRRDHDDVGVVEGALELVHQVGEPGVAVRLDDRDHPALRAPRARRRAPP